MLTRDGTAKLLDFGLAKLGDELSEGLSAPAPVSGRPGGATGAVPAAGRSARKPAAAPPGVAAPAPSEAADSAQLGCADTLQAAMVPDGLAPTQPHELSLTIAGSLLGTPGYMPPEAWRAEPATSRSDIYSLGALLYELCCGHLPHPLPDLLSICQATLEQDARPLAVVAPQVDRRLAALIDRCLQREPAARFASGVELQQALESLHAELSTPTAGAVLRRMLRRRWPVMLGVAGLLLPAAVLYHADQVRTEQRLAAATRERRSVAVVGLVRSDGEALRPGFAAAVAELLASELAVGERLRHIPTERVTQMKLDLRLAEAATYPADTLARIRQYLGSDLVVSGSYRADPARPDGLLLRMGVQDGQTGALLGSSEIGGSPAELFELVTHTGKELRRQLGIGAHSPAQAAALRAAWPQSPEIAELYAEGREHLRRFDPTGARKLLERVTAADPDFALGHLALGEVWAALGYDEKARSETKRAFELSANLPRADRYLVAARYHEAAKEWEPAVAAFQTLRSFFPDSLDYGLYLAGAQLAAGQPEAARDTVRNLRQLPAPVSQDARLDVIEARSAAEHSDYPAALALLASAAAKGAAIGAPLLVARARLEEAYALAGLGAQERALASAAAAKPLYLAAGDRGATADALMAMSAAYMYLGDVARSLEAAQEALGLLFEIQNSSLAAADLCNMALLSIKQGELGLARSRAEGGFLLAREINLLDSQGAGLIALGAIAMIQGSPEQALSLFARARASFEELGDPKMIAWVHWHIGQALLLRGDLAGARTQHQAGLRLREQHDLKSFAAESQLGLAAVALEAQLPSEAETRARAAAVQFARERRPDEESWAQALLAQALAAQDRREPAQQASERARALIARSQDRMIRMLVRRILAASQLAPDRPRSVGAVQRELTALQQEAAVAGLVTEQLELRLAQDAMRTRKGRSEAERRGRLISLGEEAARRGLGLIEQKANRLAALAGHDD